ncbi:Sec-independent protein translocase protein TatB [Microbacterium oxydans]|uniref:Sec-independent protein translocase protein TatB n=1 Tax=Microbacterium oxydans TaxID=82380 RepID=A0A0F0L5L0_9MICO|nr:twin-arginine translocase TatA/TatE family subunit [Microbacterium oxydans]KJL28462.1 Sec-independent protein translocase protein TatB [Microbacterium oxydans]CAH0131804.1 Sec-independent protein translocase protein TatB [Microbacterium oxydans]
MQFGLTFEKLMLIGLIVVLIVGPDRLPKVAEGFARMVRKAGEYLRDTKTRMRDEMGPEMDDVDWRKLDPRQYDPRRIIREALLETPAPAAAAAAAQTTIAEPAVSRAPQEFSATNKPPYDLEAT